MEYAMRISDWSSDVCSSDLNHQHRSDRHRVIKVMHAGPRLRPGTEPLAQVLVARRVAGVDAGGCAAPILEAGRPEVVAPAFAGRGRPLTRQLWCGCGSVCKQVGERNKVRQG